MGRFWRKAVGHAPHVAETTLGRLQSAGGSGGEIGVPPFLAARALDLRPEDRRHLGQRGDLLSCEGLGAFAEGFELSLDVG
jgi:hypothetical protein